MERRKGILMAATVLAALLVGAALGHAVGLAMHSDNLPFFTMLGALAAGCIGLLFAIFRELTARTGSRE